MKRLLTLLVVAAIGLGATQAFGAIDGVKVIGNFDYVYNMDVSPFTQNLDSQGGIDWAAPATPTWNTEGTYAGGIQTLVAATYMYHNMNDVYGWNYDKLTGVTVEFKLKVVADDFTGYGIRLGPNLSEGIIDVVVEPGSVTWGTSGSQTAGMTTIDTNDNASAYHTYRIAMSTDTPSYSFWRDDVLLLDEVAGGSTGSYALELGSMNGEHIEAYVDYVGITGGTWGPPIHLDEDLDGSLLIDEGDLDELDAVWGNTGTPGWIAADLYADGIIGLKDAGKIRAVWGEISAPAVAGSSVPEPVSLSLLALGSLMLLLRRHRRRV